MGVRVRTLGTVSVASVQHSRSGRQESRNGSRTGAIGPLRVPLKGPQGDLEPFKGCIRQY